MITSLSTLDGSGSALTSRINGPPSQRTPGLPAISHAPTRASPAQSAV
jgi:hypothetical protein